MDEKARLTRDLTRAYFAVNGIPTGVDEHGEPCVPTEEQRAQLFDLILSRQPEFLPVVHVARALLASATDRHSAGAILCGTIIAHSEAG
jgi:hypothetical protein